MFVAQRSTVIQSVPNSTEPKKILTILVLNKFLRLGPLGHKVEKIKLKLIPANNIETMRMTSIGILLNAAILVFLVLKPHVLHADIACVKASNQVMPAKCKHAVEAKVKPT